MPAWLVTSVNSIGPDGRGTVAVGDGDGLAEATSEEAVAAVGSSVFLQARKEQISTRQMTSEPSFIRIRLLREIEFIPTLMVRVDSCDFVDRCTFPGLNRRS